MAKFNVNYNFHGRATRTIEAESLGAAKAAIDAEINRDDFDIEADVIDDVNYYVAEMHPVTRDGREIWTTLILKTDVRGHQSALQSSPLYAAARAA